MPTPRSAHAVVATADAIYALAGTGSDGQPVLDVERFDGTRWSRVTTLPGEGINAPAAAFRPRVWVPIRDAADRAKNDTMKMSDLYIDSFLRRFECPGYVLRAP